MAVKNMDNITIGFIGFGLIMVPLQNQLEQSIQILL